MGETRAGVGYDVHPLVAGRPLILGGVRVEYEMGLSGHSDADVLMHAIADALLGCLGKGDIGTHYPPDDPQFKDMPGSYFLEDISAMLIEEGFGVVNIDATILAEEPKLVPFFPQMKERIATTLKVEPSRINLKATTTEGLGFVGERKGMAAISVALVSRQ